MPKINELYAFISVDRDAEDEGIIAMRINPTTWMPLVGANLQRMESLRRIAYDIARRMKRPVKLVKFSNRTDLEVLQVQEPCPKPKKP